MLYILEYFIHFNNSSVGHVWVMNITKQHNNIIVCILQQQCMYMYRQFMYARRPQDNSRSRNEFDPGVAGDVMSIMMIDNNPP